MGPVLIAVMVLAAASSAFADIPQRTSLFSDATCATAPVSVIVGVVSSCAAFGCGDAVPNTETACPATYDELGLQYSWGKYAVANVYQTAVLSNTSCTAPNLYQHHAWPSGGACLNFAGAVYGNGTCSSENIATIRLCTSPDCTTGCSTYTGDTCVVINEFSGFYGTFTCEQGPAPTDAPSTPPPSGAPATHASVVLLIASAAIATVVAAVTMV